MDFREVKEIEYVVRCLIWDINNFDKVVSILYIKKVDNFGLEWEYYEKKIVLWEEGRFFKELI